MTSAFPRKDWSTAPRRTALSPTQLVSALAQMDGWRLAGSGAQTAIEKEFRFANYFETMAFVNAVAFIAHVADHHPDLQVAYSRCVVRLSTHDAHGVSQSDFECAGRIDALLVAHP
jgi:4a-hydroxytetrahydrobiopterin dehydratase